MSSTNRPSNDPANRIPPNTPASNKPAQPSPTERHIGDVAKEVISPHDPSSSNTNLSERVSKPKAPERRILELAHKINIGRLCLEKLNLSLEDLTKLAPYLNFVDCRGLSISDKELHDFINKLQNAQIIIISSNITSLSIPANPNLQTLDCSGCTSLTTLTIPENSTLQTLNCSGCRSLTTLTLPEKSTLQTLNCFGCTRLTTLTIPENSTLQTLNCSYCTSLTTLTIPENATLHTLDCYDCTSLTTLILSENSTLQTLDCSGCTSLTTLTIPENSTLQTLNCSGCRSLTTLTLPENSTLQTLNCSYCTSLTTLTIPENSTLQDLNCSDCESLTMLTLPENSTLQTLNCSDCENLTTLTLPENSTLQNLDCYGCTSLTTLTIPENSILQTLNCTNCTSLITLTIPENSTLQDLDCSDCTSLTGLGAEALPNIINLTCSDCPLLTQLPQLPLNTIVYSSSSGFGAVHTFTVDSKTLEENPLSVLLQLGRNHLLRQQAFPNISFIDSPGIDAGGLRRHLVYALFKGIISDQELFTGEDKQKLPVLAKDADADKQDAIKTIGRLFGLCFHTSLLTGAHFDPKLFDAIHWLLDAENRKQDHLDERVYAVLQGYNYDALDDETKELIPDMIKNTVYPIRLIAEQMRLTSQIPSAASSSILRKNIEGVSVDSAKTLLEHCIWDPQQATPEQLEKMQNYFKNWAERQAKENQQKLEDFVVFATGSSALGIGNIQLELYPNRDKDQLPVAHTCFFTCEMPIYDSQEVFDQKIEQALSSITGFQFG